MIDPCPVATFECPACGVMMKGDLRYCEGRCIPASNGGYVDATSQDSVEVGGAHLHVKCTRCGYEFTTPPVNQDRCSVLRGIR